MENSKVVKVSTMETKLIVGYKLISILDEIPGSKKKSPRILVEFKRGRFRPETQWYGRYHANTLFGTDQMEAMRVKVVEEVEAQGTSL